METSIYQNSPEVRLTNFIVNSISESFKGLEFVFDLEPVKPFSKEVVHYNGEEVVVMVGQIINEYTIMNDEYAIQDIIEDVVAIINNGIINGWDEV